MRREQKNYKSGCKTKGWGVNGNELDSDSDLGVAMSLLNSQVSSTTVRLMFVHRRHGGNQADQSKKTKSQPEHRTVRDE